MLAGRSEAAVERAARHGWASSVQTNHGGLKELYENECRAHGHEPGIVSLPPTTLRPPCSSPTTSTRHGTSWVRTCCTTR